MVHINIHLPAATSLPQGGVQQAGVEKGAQDTEHPVKGPEQANSFSEQGENDILETKGTRVKPYSKDLYNLQDDLTRLQIADEGVKSLHSHLNKARKNFQAALDQDYTEESRAEAGLKAREHLAQVEAVLDKTRFNGERLLEKNPDQGDGLDLAELEITVLEGGNPAQVYTSLRKLDNAISKLSAQRFRIGGMISHLRQKLDTAMEIELELPGQDRGLIRDAGTAREVFNSTQNRVLLDTSQALLAQANTQVEKVFRLLHGVQEQ